MAKKIEYESYKMTPYEKRKSAQLLIALFFAIVWIIGIIYMIIKLVVK